MIFWVQIIVINKNYIKVENMSQALTKPVLDAYKTIGSFVHGPVCVSQTQPLSIVVGCYNSFKIYSQQLAIKMVSPCFSSPIRALHIHNEHTYVIVDRLIIKIEYHHVVNKWQLPQPKSTGLKHKIKQNVSILVFDGVIIVSVGSSIFTVPELSKKQIQSGKISQIEELNLDINLISIVHPVTYINKILAYNSTQIILVNPISQKILYNYSAFTKQFSTQNKSICLVCPSPIIDIVAVCLDSGQIIIFNIRTSKTVFTMKQKKAVSALSFSHSQNLMVSADETGNIILWDLQNKNIIYRLQYGFPTSVDFLHFVPGLPLIVAASSKSNSIKQFRINREDNKTLLQFRQRTGCSPLTPIINVKCQNNKQITFSTKSNTVFSSLYSHSNMYQLPYCLDSILPYHIVARNFNMQVYRQRSIIGKLNIHENIQSGVFSLSKKFAIIGTKSRIIKVAIPGGVKPTTQLHILQQWKIDSITQIVLCGQHYIYAICSDSIYILDFNQPNLIASINVGQNCNHPVSNSSQTMLALQNRTKENIQIWDMKSITLIRQFKLNQKQLNTTKICFTTDNKYLLSAHINGQVMIWSVIQSDLYKKIKLQHRIMDMCFTPDNSYFLCVFEGAKQINIWHNYIGKITSSQNNEEVYKFQTSLNYLSLDYRQNLNSQKQNYQIANTATQNQIYSLLDQIEDVPSNFNYRYDFSNVSKWMPLVYYDQIRNRNSINKSDQIPSLPFFLDFKNLNDEQAKIKKKINQQTKQKKRKQQEKVDAQLSSDSHEIRLNQQSTQQQQQRTWSMLSKLSIAQVDYQLRKFLLMPGNSQYLIKMCTQVIQNKKCDNLMILNIVMVRILEIIGTELCSQEYKQIVQELSLKISNQIQQQENIVKKCIAIASKNI